jgi:hypothetical protein
LNDDHRDRENQGRQAHHRRGDGRQDRGCGVRAADDALRDRLVIEEAVEGNRPKREKRSGQHAQHGHEPEARPEVDEQLGEAHTACRFSILGAKQDGTLTRVGRVGESLTSERRGQDRAERPGRFALRARLGDSIGGEFLPRYWMPVSMWKSTRARRPLGTRTLRGVRPVPTPRFGVVTPYLPERSLMR